MKLRYTTFKRWAFVFMLLSLGLIPGSIPVMGIEEREPEAYTSQRILTLPINDYRVRVQAGWSEHNIMHKGVRGAFGVDYILGTQNQSSTWESFDIVAAAAPWVPAQV